MNYGGADGRAIYQLAEKIRQKVEERFSVTIEPEVRIVDSTSNG